MFSIRTTSSLLLRICRRTVRRLSKWWLTEFLGLFPRRVAVWLMHCGPKRATLTLAPSAIFLAVEDDAGRSPVPIEVRRSECSRVVLDQFLRAHKLDRKNASIGLRIPADMIFRRRLAFPIEVADSLEAAAAQDLALNTPFQLAHVYHDQCTITDGGGIIAHQWVVPRAAIADALEPLGESVSSIAFIEAISATDEKLPRPYINVSKNRTPRKPLLRTFALGL